MVCWCTLIHCTCASNTIQVSTPSKGGFWFIFIFACFLWVRILVPFYYTHETALTIHREGTSLSQDGDNLATQTFQELSWLLETKKKSSEGTSGVRRKLYGDKIENLYHGIRNRNGTNYRSRSGLQKQDFSKNKRMVAISVSIDWFETETFSAGALPLSGAKKVLKFSLALKLACPLNLEQRPVWFSAASYFRGTEFLFL